MPKEGFGGSFHFLARGDFAAVFAAIGIALSWRYFSKWASRDRTGDEGSRAQSRSPASTFAGSGNSLRTAVSDAISSRSASTSFPARPSNLASASRAYVA